MSSEFYNANPETDPEYKVSEDNQHINAAIKACFIGLLAIAIAFLSWEIHSVNLSFHELDEKLTALE